MAISVTCDACGFTFQLKDHCAGKRGRCPGCDAAIAVPLEPTRLPGSSAQMPDEDDSTAVADAFDEHGRAAISSFPAWARYGTIMAAMLAVGAATFYLGRMGHLRDGAAAPPADRIVAEGGDKPAAEAAASEASSIAPPVKLSASDPVKPPIAQTNRNTDAGEQGGKEPWQAKDMAELIEIVEPSVVRIDVEGLFGKAGGSGFVVDRAGIVVTNHHVIERARSATAVFPDGSTAPVTGVFKTDAARDIALLKIDYPADKLKPVKLAAALPRKGEQVVGFGAPLGLSFTASQGIVSAIRSEKEIKNLGMPVSGTWIQTTTPISPGNSGGPLVNMRGEVVAANTMTLVRGQNLNFAVSALDIRAVMQGMPKTPVPLAQAIAATPGTAPGTIDASSTERGRLLLAKTKQVSLLVSSFSFDPTGRVKQIVEFHVNRCVKLVGLSVTEKPDAATPQFVVTLGLTAGPGAGGSRLLLEAMLTCKDQDEAGRPVTVQAWKINEMVGAPVTETDLQRGTLPIATESELGALFERFSTDHAAAVRRTAPPAGGG